MFLTRGLHRNNWPPMSAEAERTRQQLRNEIPVSNVFITFFLVLNR